MELTVDSRADGSALTARARCGSLCPPVAHSPVAVESLARRYEMWRPHLTERRRRLWLGGRGAGAACGWAGGGRPSSGGSCGHGAARSRSRGARRSGAAAGGVSHTGRDARRHGLGIRELAARHGVHRRTMSVSATAGCRYQNCSLGCGGLARSPQRLTRQVGRRIAEVCGQWRT